MKTIFKLTIITLGLFLLQSCSNSVCEYDEDTINPNCHAATKLNLTTGIQADNSLLPPGDGVVDPFWRVINNPPLINCTSALASTINGNAYVINFGSSGPNQWVNQAGAATLAPVDLGTTNGFGCNNAINSDGDKVPYVFERSFCVLNDTNIDFSFTYKGDDKIYFVLVDNSDNSILSTSATYVWTVDPALTWTATNLAISAGSYSIRGYLVNTNAIVLGMSFLGNLSTTNNDESISNNGGCCENNTISVTSILDENCDTILDVGEALAENQTFYLKDVNGNIIRTEVTDVNGSVFFSGLPDGDYTVEKVPLAGWTTATVLSYSFTIQNNEVKMLNFHNCHN